MSVRKPVLLSWYLPCVRCPRDTWSLGIFMWFSLAQNHGWRWVARHDDNLVECRKPFRAIYTHARTHERECLAMDDLLLFWAKMAPNHPHGQKGYQNSISNIFHITIKVLWIFLTACVVKVFHIISQLTNFSIKTRLYLIIPEKKWALYLFRRKIVFKILITN